MKMKGLINILIFLLLLPVDSKACVTFDLKIMKSILFLLILTIGSMAYGQTDSIEKAILRSKLNSKVIKESDFQKTISLWTQKTNETRYTDLPVDQNGEVHYTFINEFKNFEKETLFNRTLEWLAINYGLIPADVYSNSEDGKIIFRNSLELKTDNFILYTSVISIKDEKIMAEFISLVYQTFYEGHYEYDSWIPDKTVNVPIKDVFPVILKKTSEWDTYLKLLKTTNDLINTEIKNLSDYILTYENSYKF